MPDVVGGGELRGSSLSRLLASDKVLVNPGIYDALTAKVAEQLDFEMSAMAKTRDIFKGKRGTYD